MAESSLPRGTRLPAGFSGFMAYCTDVDTAIKEAEQIAARAVTKRPTPTQTTPQVVHWVKIGIIGFALCSTVKSCFFPATHPATSESSTTTASGDMSPGTGTSATDEPSNDEPEQPKQAITTRTQPEADASEGTSPSPQPDSSNPYLASLMAVGRYQPDGSMKPGEYGGAISASEEPEAQELEAQMSTTNDPPDDGMTLIKPKIGGSMLTIAEIRYCDGEDIRIDAERAVMNNLRIYNVYRFNHNVKAFNASVEDVNRRCSNRLYYMRDRSLADSQLEAQKMQLEEEGRNRIE